MKLYHRIALGVGIVVALTSCNDFLSHDPDDRTQIRTPEDAAELNVSSYSDYSLVPIFEMRCDNTQDKGVAAQVYSNDNAQLYRYDEYVSSSYQDSPEGLWRDSYRAIAHANQVLLDLEKMDQDAPEVKETKGEALICRAYALYMLAQTFTIPYDPATAETALGLPCPTEPETHLIQEYERGTLQQLYDVIVADFEAGFALVGDNYKSPKYHFNRQAAAAFGTRLYRTLGNWDRVIELGEDCFGGAPQLYTRKVNDVNSLYQGTYQEREQVWGHETEDCNFLVSVLISNWTRYFAYEKYGMTIPFMRYIRPSKEIGGERIFAGNNFLGVAPFINFYGSEIVINIPKFYEHFEFTNVTLGTGYIHGQFVLFSGDEVLFNLAEAYAMKDQYDRSRRMLQLFVDNWMNFSEGYFDDEAFVVTEEKILSYYQDLLGNQPHPDPFFGIEIRDFNPFFETTPKQEAYLRAAVDLKRIAFLLEGMRWMDNRQYRMDIVHNIVAPDGSGESYLILRGDDPRYAVQIPENTAEYLEPNPGYETPLEPISK